MHHKIITIKDTKEYSHLMKASDELNISDCKEVEKIAKFLRETLCDKISALNHNPPDHDKPAYLAANQIGIDKSVVILYLPPTANRKFQEFVMVNPSYEVLELQNSDTKQDFLISTFFADQMRFSNQCYAAKIIVRFRDAYWAQKFLELEGTAAIAAQMGINYIKGVTPLDFNITTEELLAFAERNDNATHGKLMTTRDAYLKAGRKIDEQDPEFSKDPEQLKYIKGFVEERKNYPRIYGPVAGERILEKEIEEQDLRFRMSP